MGHNFCGNLNIPGQWRMISRWSVTDVEVKYSLKVNLLSLSVNIINASEKTSSWKKNQRIMVGIMKYKEALWNLAKKQKANTDGRIVEINLLKKGETAVIAASLIWIHS